MAIQRPISTISYNTEAFLKEKLDSWVNAHILQAYMYICHKGEDGDKDHIHLRIEPNKRLDQMDLTEQLKEFVQGDKSQKPRGVRPWRPSKEEDWILYAVHDKEYLRGKYGDQPKGEKLPYDWKNIVASEGYDVEAAYIRAKGLQKHTSASLAKRIKGGESAFNMALEGENPYMIGNLLRLMNATDYERVVAEYNDTIRRYNLLLGQIVDLGFQVDCNDNGDPIIRKDGDFEIEPLDS